MLSCKNLFQGYARLFTVVTKMVILRRFANAIEWRNGEKLPMLGMNLILIIEVCSMKKRGFERAINISE